MTQTIDVPIQIINGPALQSELQTAGGAAYQGYSQGAKWPGMIRLHFADGTAQPVIDAALAAYAAHDPSVKTPEQAKVAAQEAALTDLKAVDFAALQKSGTLQEVRDAVFKLALAFGLADPPDGKG